VGLLAISHHSGVRLAEVGFVLMLIAGVALALTPLPTFKGKSLMPVVAGATLALAGLLLLIATHWGSFA
jgi:hypothetical protein